MPPKTSATPPATPPTQTTASPPASTTPPAATNPAETPNAATPPPAPPQAPPPAPQAPQRPEPTDIECLEHVLKVLSRVKSPRLDGARVVIHDLLSDMKKEAAEKHDRQKQLNASAQERGFKSVEEMLEHDVQESARLEKEAEELGFGSAALMARAGKEAIEAARAKKRGYRSVEEMNRAEKK